jgi:hypothetical protein
MASHLATELSLSANPAAAGCAEGEIYPDESRNNMSMTRKRIFISSVQKEFAQIRRVTFLRAGNRASLRHMGHAGLLTVDYYLRDTYGEWF